jgi:uncharacterized tellurite resistance protein B-like protein
MRACLLALVVLFMVSSEVSSQAIPVSEDCKTCHLGLDEERLVEPARLFENDIHAEVGFGCLACHGSGGLGPLDPGAGFLSVPSRRQIPELCGRCHSDGAYMRQFDPNIRIDQVLEYWTSRHGILLSESDDPDVATCIDCHPAHQIRPPSDVESSVYALNVPETCGRCHSDAELMQGRDIPTDQVEKHTTSVHGVLLYEEGDVSAPVCNDCHGNHGAAPPGIGSVRNVCGQCHVVMAEFFDASAHSELFEEEGLPLCAACHEHHDVQPVDEQTLTERSAEICSQCHTPNDEARYSFDGMATVLDSLSDSVEDSRHRLEEAEQMGMEVSQSLFELEDVNNAQTRARSAIHTFSIDAVRTEAEAGFEIADGAGESADDAFAEYDFRRLGLGVSSGIILLLIVGLLLKIREADERTEGVLAEVAAYYSKSISPSWTGAPTAEQVRLASCAILLEAAYSDGRFSEDERAHLEELIHWRFGLVASEAEELLELAEVQRNAPEGLGTLARVISQNFSLEQNRILLEELWLLVYSDGELSVREIEFVESSAKLMGMDARELTKARQWAHSQMSSSDGGSAEAT